MSTITFIPNAPTAPRAIADLREAVGWERHDEDYPTALKGYWATMSGFDFTGALVAWCAILSDDVRHAVLIDVIVHPNWQRQGVGQELVTVAVKHIQAHSISIIHVDFEPAHKTFYERCGFPTGLGGIYQGRFPDLTDYRSILTFGPDLEVDGFELMFYPDWTAEIEHIASELLKSGLKFPAIHAEKGIGPALVSSKPDEREQGWQWMHASCQLGKLLGANLLVFHLWGFPDYDEKIEQNLQQLEHCMKIAEEFELKVAVETIPCKREDPLSNVRRAIEQEPRVLLALDTEFLAMHNQLNTALTADWLWHENRVRHIHIKDYDGGLYSTDNFRRYLHPGEGCINFPKFFDTLRLRNFSGSISLETSVVNHDGIRDIQQLKKSLSILREMIHNS